MKDSLKQYSPKAPEKELAVVYPRNTIEKKLGMDTVRAYVGELCASAPARELVDNMFACKIYSTVRGNLLMTSEMKIIAESDTPLSFSGLTDTRDWFARLATAGSFIEVEELVELRNSLSVAESVTSFFKAKDEEEENSCPALSKLASDMFDVHAIISIINAVINAAGTVKDNASPELQDIRNRLSTIQHRISSAMKKVINRAVSEGIIDSDVQPSVRDGRLVIPLPSMNKRRISGIVHDESSTGKTSFVEPAEVVELGNEQRELELAERREIVRILIETASKIRPAVPDLINTFGILYELDFINAKALFAVKTGGNMPRLVDKCDIEWHDARHPVLRLNLEARNRAVVPLNIDLTDETSRILVVSGPNAGGKSVALKTVGINQYMLQCGLLPVLEPNSRAGIFDGIFVDLGDDQSIEDDLSTYSSHLRNMKYILNHGTNRSLFLIDEFGSGTEPQIGGAIAQALLSEFNNKGMWGVVTTHYQNLKQFAQDTPGVMNGSMIYDRQLMKPTFRLLAGNPGSSFAVEIASRTGLPKSIIAEAERIVGTDYFNLDKYLLDINRDRRYWENKRLEIKRREKHLEEVISRYEQNAENLRQQRRAIIDEAKTQADDIIARSNAAVESTIREIKKVKAEKEETRLLRQKLAEKRQQIANDVPEEHKELRRAPKPKKQKQKNAVVKKPEKIEVGNNVLLDNQGQPGTVLEINRDKATVAFGLMKLNVPLSRLTLTIRKPSSGASDGVSIVSSQTVEASRQRQLHFKPEIDLRGMRADEALQTVMYFIDDAIQFNAGRVRILHGTGTGALRTTIRGYLATVPAVRAFRDEDVRMGGAGITVVDLS